MTQCKQRFLVIAIQMVAILPATAVADVFLWELNAVSSNWNNVLNWAGTNNEFPDDNTDEAIVTIPSTQGSPTLNASNITIGDLIISSNGDLNTGNGTDNFALTVQSSNFQSGSTMIDGAGSSLTVWQSPVGNDFDTDDLMIDGGSLILRQGAKAQVDGLLDLSQGDIFGTGVLELNGDTNFSNDGTIRAAFGGTLTIQRTGTERIDLDGSGENGSLVADNNSRLIIDLPNTGPNFDGSLTIGEEAEIQINDNWDLRSTAGTVLSFNGNSGNATLSGTNLTLSGLVNINSGTAILAAPTTVTSTADINISDNTSLQFDAPTTVDNPNSLDNEYATTLIVNDAVDIGSGAGIFNWDGESQNLVLNGATIVNPGGRLNIDVDRVDSAVLDERVATRLRINSGRIDVQNTADFWELQASLRLDNQTGEIPTLSGAEVLLHDLVRASGTGESQITAPVILASTSQVVVLDGARLDLHGATTVIEGGRFEGSGEVELNSPTTTIAVSTTVDMPNGTFDLDGIGIATHLLEINRPLTLNIQTLDNEDTNGIDKQTQINPFGWLDVQFSNANDSYRFDQTLELNALSGINASAHLRGADVELAGDTTVTGNSLSLARVDVTGNLSVALGGSFNFDGGSYAEPNVIFPQASIVGEGPLRNLSDSRLVMEDGAHASLLLENSGTLTIGSASGFASVNAFTQKVNGTIEFGIDGLDPGDTYDQLDVDQLAALDGTLAVDVNQAGGSYTDPSVAGDVDEFLLIAANAFAGDFATFVYDEEILVATFTDDGQERYHIDEGLFRILGYQPTELTLRNYKALGGDANGDGSVDGQDFLVWNTNKFTDGTDWLTGDFNGDGTTDGQDFLIWNSNKFMTAFDTFAVPEPTSGLLVLACSGWVVARRRRC